MLFGWLPFFLLGFFIGCAVMGLCVSLIDEIQTELRKIGLVIVVIFGWLTFMFILLVTDSV